ncbi:MAG: hypothetical protein IJZ35_03885 [Clostridia bacterium]|nr:hypothetical protein [Clostridia bacterium]
MAKMDHYENGVWVGSSEIKGHSNTTGWVDTYSADGKVRSTMVHNTDQFDYKESEHREKSIEEIRSSVSAAKTVSEFRMKVLDFVYKLAIRFIFPASAIVGAICLAAYFVLKALPNEIIEKLQSMSVYVGIALGILLHLAGIVFAIYVFMPSKSKKKSKKNKKIIPL